MSWRVVPPALVVVVVLGWSCSEAVDRQEWLPDSSASKAMAKARFRCKEDNFYDAAGTQHREYIDPNGNAFEATGLGSGEANDALNQCARANLGADAIPPVNWLKVTVVGVVLLAFASLPWVYWRIRGSDAEVTP